MPVLWRKIPSKNPSRTPDMRLMAHDEPTSYIGEEFFDDDKPVLQLACSRCLEPWFCPHVRTVIGQTGPSLGRIFKTSDLEANYEYRTVKFAMPFNVIYEALHVVRFRKVPDTRGILHLLAPLTGDPYAIINGKFESLWTINFMVERWVEASIGCIVGYECHGCHNDIVTLESMWSFLHTNAGICYRCYLQRNAEAAAAVNPF